MGNEIPYIWGSDRHLQKIRLGYFDGSLFATIRTSNTGGRIVKISTTGSLIRSVAFSALGINGAPNAIDVDADGPVIATTARGVYRLNDDLGDPTLLFTSQHGVADLALVGDEIWILRTTGVIIHKYSLSGADLGSVTISPATILGLAVTDTHIFTLDSTLIRAYTHAGVAVPSLNVTLTTGSEQGLVALPAAFWTASGIVSGTPGLTRYDLTGLAIQDFSIRRSTDGGSTWRYFNAANTGTSQWTTTDTPQPACRC